MVLEERATDGFSDQSPNEVLLMKSHLAFRRMDIDIDFRRVQFDEQASDWIATLHQGSMISLNQGIVQAAMLDGPTVDEEVLVLARGARDARRADEPPHFVNLSGLLLAGGIRAS
jgi:hypothetical protein